MKKIALTLCAALALGLLAACGGGTSSSSSSSAPSSGEAALTGTLEELMTGVYEGIGEDEMPAVMNTPLDADNSEYYTGLTSGEYAEGLASDAMINAVAHSVVLLRAESPEKAEALAKAVEEKADPRKWICVEAEKKIVDRIGDVVILIMTQEELADKLDSNFKALAEK